MILTMTAPGREDELRWWVRLWPEGASCRSLWGSLAPLGGLRVARWNGDSLRGSLVGARGGGGLLEGFLTAARKAMGGDTGMGRLPAVQNTAVILHAEMKIIKSPGREELSHIPH